MTALTEIRLSNHNVMTDRRRHQRLSENQSLSPFYDNKVESEYHFFIECKKNHVLRQKLVVEMITNLICTMITKNSVSYPQTQGRKIYRPVPQ